MTTALEGEGGWGQHSACGLQCGLAVRRKELRLALRTCPTAFSRTSKCTELSGYELHNFEMPAKTESMFLGINVLACGRDHCTSLGRRRGFFLVW
jgi:hypothetical protein